jgi:anti-sigma regulatory factor (Ser/Thr protein kinase)
MGSALGVLTLPSSPEAPAVAREHMRELGSSWPPDVLEAVLLAASEAVTNAVRYGQGGGIEFAAQVSDGVVRIEVTDRNPDPPLRRPRTGNGLTEGGLGLYLLDALTRAWGTYAREDTAGKTVWIELTLSSPR